MGQWKWRMQASYRRALQPDHEAQHAHLDRHLAACILPDTVHQTTTHAAEHHAAQAPWWLTWI